MRARKITAINAHEKCRLSTGMDGRLSAVICAEKRGLNLARFLPSLTSHSTLLANRYLCGVIGRHHHVGCREGNEQHKTIDSTPQTCLLTESGKLNRADFHAVVSCATAHPSSGLILLGYHNSCRSPVVAGRG